MKGLSFKWIDGGLFNELTKGKADKGKKRRKQVIEIGVDSEGNAMEDDMRMKTGGRYQQDRKDRKTGRKGRRPKEANLFDE